MTENTASPTTAAEEAEEEVVGICQDLIRIDTTTPGDHSGPGERVAAEYVAGLLAEVGLESQVFESHPKRTSLVARMAGEDRTRPALLIHGHLDVVPANAKDWQRDPFGGDIADGCVWGRGAIDMKDMDAIVLAVVRQRLREQRKPARRRARVYRRRGGRGQLGRRVPGQ
jgi:acetylornithine deacetylase/succinyl-diaminopimelate desuccinylase-like protein